MKTADERPSWACSQYGGYEHDWLDCPDCVKAYEEEQESGASNSVEEFLAKLATDYDIEPIDCIAFRHELIRWIKPLLIERGVYIDALDKMTPGTMGSYCTDLAQEARKRWKWSRFDPSNQPQKNKLELPTEKTDGGS